MYNCLIGLKSNLWKFNNSEQGFSPTNPIRYNDLSYILIRLNQFLYYL
jgi:hypothetical protein